MKWWESGKDFTGTSNSVGLRVNRVRINRARPVKNSYDINRWNCIVETKIQVYFGMIFKTYTLIYYQLAAFGTVEEYSSHTVHEIK